MSSTWLPWTVAILLATLLVVTVVLLQRRLSRLSASHKDQMQSAASQHAQQLERDAQAHQKELNASGSREEALSRGLAQALGYDLRSRNSLLQACSRAGLDGFLISNIVFLRPNAAHGEARYRRQIDHVIITENKLLLVENKGWKGLVFDGVLPSSRYQDLRFVVDESQLGKTFAVHIGGREQSIRVSDTVPVDQAVKQTRDIKDLMSEHGLSDKQVEVCVFYSHPEVKLHAADDQTAWRVRVIDSSQLKEVLTTPESDEQYPVDDVVEVFARYAGDMAGFGKFESKMPARF